VFPNAKTAENGNIPPLFVDYIEPNARNAMASTKLNTTET